MPHRSTSKNTELLAPAGSIEHFHAAVEAGADAVYLGLTDFNARLRAKNFSVKTLSYVVPCAHERNVKVYVTLNTLLKQADLEAAIHLLHELSQIGPDALIVTDLGLIAIARAHFPRLALHGSTQMVIHNSAGVMMAEKLGLCRVILSRELTVDEIAAIRRKSGLELEVFIHGALCYSISGLCLASSFLGGSSGNRGRCTQVCRRRFSAGRFRGYYFSPRDLEALDFLPRLTELGIASFKIEGRMKNPEYVYQVTRAYRMAIDDPSRIQAAKKILADDLGRKKTSFFLTGLPLPGTVDAVSPGMGARIGEIAEVAGKRIVAAGATVVQAGDRIRIQPREGFEGDATTVDSVETAGQRSVLVLKKEVACKAGDAVYLISRGSMDRRFNRTTIEGVEPVRYNERSARVRAILNTYNREPQKTPRRDTLWIVIDDPRWLDLLQATPCQRLVFAGNRERLLALLADAPALRVWKSRLVPALPPFIPEADLPAWRSIIGRFRAAGIDRWMCANIGHATLFEKQSSLIADSPIGCLNRASQSALNALGVPSFVFSIEDDYLNIKASSSPNGLVRLFSPVLLFISRLHPAVKIGAMVSDPHNNRFQAVATNGLYYLVSEKPFCITHRRAKLAELGIHDFMLDLCFRSPDPEFLSLLVGCYRDNTRLPDTSLFNFKAGLK
jgi:putative protease